MELKNRVAIISHENLSDLMSLYGELNIDRLSGIVNNHIRVAIDEIKEDLGMSNRVPHCGECERMQCMEYPYKDYYCCVENEPMQVLGYVGVDSPPKTSPKWCPQRKGIYEKY